MVVVKGMVLMCEGGERRLSGCALERASRSPIDDWKRGKLLMKNATAH